MCAWTTLLVWRCLAFDSISSMYIYKKKRTERRKKRKVYRIPAFSSNDRVSLFLIFLPPSLRSLSLSLSLSANVLDVLLVVVTCLWSCAVAARCRLGSPLASSFSSSVTLFAACLTCLLCGRVPGVRLARMVCWYLRAALSLLLQAPLLAL